jgi:hypothetical protein
LPLGDKFDLAQAFVDQARAFLTLGKVDRVVHSLDQALQREQEFPHVKTGAWSEFAMLIATERLRARFEDAIRVLQANQGILMFPVDQFQWHAAYALIMKELDDGEAAKAHARQALKDRATAP